MCVLQGVCASEMTSDKALKEAVDKLKELSKGNTEQKLSVELRKTIVELKSSTIRHSGPAHAFFINGGPQILLTLLSQCACAVQDTVLLLGLLGNLCALDKSTREIVMTEHKLIVGVLSAVTYSDVLNTSARLIANLALDHTHIPTLQADGVVLKLTNSLSRGVISNTCKRSILRTLRVLASNSDCRDEIASLDGVQAVAECLQSHDGHVTSSAIQTLQALTQDSDLVQPLCNKPTLQLIVQHCHHSQPSVRESAMRVLLNTAKTSDGRVSLSSVGGVETLVGFLQTYASQTSVLREVVSAACLCCRDVTSRQRLRDCGGLARLIGMLADDKLIFVHGNILSALVCYYFDEATLKTMVKNMGLLKALVFHMTREPVQDELNCPDPGSMGEQLTVGDISPLDSETDLDCCSDQEPGPSVSTISDLPAGNELAPTNQPATREIPSISLEDLPDITPPPAKRPRLQLDLESSTPLPPNFLDSLLSSPNPYTADPKPLHSPLPHESSLHYQVILLLSRVSHLRDCLPVLSSPETLSQVIQSFVSFDPPNLHVFKVLTRVFMNPHCFQDTLLTLAPSKLFQNLRSSLQGDLAATGQGESVFCKDRSLASLSGELLVQLSKVAESPYGQGVLAHMLLRGEEREKQASCLSLPILCRSVRVSKKMMLSYGGFNELSSLATSDGDLQSMALDSLLALMINTHSFTLYHSAPTEMKLSKRCRYKDSDHCPFDLTMVVCGPEGRVARVPVHKRVLVEASDVFSVMLDGGYSEGGRDEVTLRDLPPLAFVSLVHHLYGCGWQCPDIFAHPLSDVTMEMDELSSLASRSIVDSITATVTEDRGKARHCLNVLACAGRFLLTELSTLCQHAAVNFVSPGNVVEMFYFANMHECYCLSESCIRVVMALEHKKLRRDVFRDLVTSCVGETVLSMLRMFLSVAEGVVIPKAPLYVVCPN